MMGKRYYHLWSEVASFDNLLLALRKASLGKRNKASIAAFEYRLEENLFELQEERAAARIGLGWSESVRRGSPSPSQTIESNRPLVGRLGGGASVLGLTGCGREAGQVQSGQLHGVIAPIIPGKPRTCNLC
ncbi:MAG: hypothetical protein HZY76_11395 [Anaerolineae bacterium]|nr:MAG: hypothetical protein HZY76_11395 [Anaerolineae bacterium]